MSDHNPTDMQEPASLASETQREKLGLNISDRSLEKLWSLVEKTDNHWFWIGRWEKGYPVFSLRRDDTWRVKRLLWTIERGYLRPLVRIYRQCNNEACVNPHHHFVTIHPRNPR